MHLLMLVTYANGGYVTVSMALFFRVFI